MKKTSAYITSYKAQALATMDAIPEEQIADLIGLLARVRQEGRQVFICGNGGSAASASHLANDLGKGASVGRKLRFRVLSLTDNIPWITALANDSTYAEIFVDQLRNFARPGDLLVAFSGSGNSPNIVKAVEWAAQEGLLTVGLTGETGGRLGQLARFPILVQSSHMGHIEEAHFLILHLVSYYFMEVEEQEG